MTSVSFLLPSLQKYITVPLKVLVQLQQNWWYRSFNLEDVRTASAAWDQDFYKKYKLVLEGVGQQIVNVG